MNLRDKIEDGFFLTSDIDLVTALSLTYSVAEISPSENNSKRAVFYFEATDELLDYVNRYRKRQVLVEPKAYYFQLREVRSQINDLFEQE